MAKEDLNKEKDMLSLLKAGYREISVHLLLGTIETINLYSYNYFVLLELTKYWELLKYITRK